jgi:hypothetical protein
VAGKLHKKYIGKSSELSTAKLEEIAEALNTPSSHELHKELHRRLLLALPMTG